MSVVPKGQVTLPMNPNGVVFLADAETVLGGRSPREVLELGRIGLEALYQESGLSAAFALAWRVAIDRKNERRPQVMVVFVFDGPATKGHLAALEASMRNSVVPWSPAQIERMPQNRALGLMRLDGRLLQLWESSDRGPVVRDLVLSERGVSIRERGPQEVDHSDFPVSVRHMLARPPRFEDHDADLERMRLVFARHFANLIVEADGRIREEELVFLDTVFPNSLMRQLDLNDDLEIEAWLDRAFKELPHALGHHDKLAMIGLFFSACYSDGALDAREMRVLREAGESLGMETRDVARYLERFW